jgi:zinc D-Ala-D-Ala dipeptidase
MTQRRHWIISIVLLLTIPDRPLLSHAASTDALVNLQTVAPSIHLDMRYATTNNFLKQAVYPHATCLLRSATAAKLAAAQRALARRGLGLKVFDCYRPLSVQRRMWAILPDADYVANPKTGSRHNRGAAVDVTLVDRSGIPLEMPSEFDDFSERAHADYAAASARAKAHRRLLRSAMTQHGFQGISTEWWHFDDSQSQRYGLLDVDWSDARPPSSQ